MDDEPKQVRVVFTTNEEDLVLPESKRQLFVPASESSPRLSASSREEWYLALWLAFYKRRRLWILKSLQDEVSGASPRGCIVLKIVPGSMSGATDCAVVNVIRYLYQHEPSRTTVGIRRRLELAQASVL